MSKRIDIDARIESVRLEEQGSAPVSPGAGFTHVWAKSDGLYIVNDSDEEIGPFITGVPSEVNTIVIYEDEVFKVTGTAIDFTTNMNVIVTGTVAFVSSEGGVGATDVLLVQVFS